MDGVSQVDMSNLPFFAVKPNGYCHPKLSKLIKYAGKNLDSVKTIILPGDISRDTVCMWEMGGIQDERGIASIVATPEGLPSTNVRWFTNKPRACTRQALIPVYKNSLLGVGSYNCGNVVIYIYKVNYITQDNRFPSSALVYLHLMATVKKSWQTNNRPITTYESVAEEDVAAYDRVAWAMIEKFNQKYNEVATYASPYKYIGRDTGSIVVNGRLVDTPECSSFGNDTIILPTLDKFLEETFTTCYHLKDKSNEVPVRQIIYRIEDGEQYIYFFNTVYMPIVKHSKKITSEAYAKYLYKARIDDAMVFPMDRNRVSKISSKEELLEALDRRFIIDNWMTYIGN